MGFYMGEGFLYVIFLILAVLSVFAQFNVTSTFKKFSKIQNSRGYTGADVARLLLEQNGITDVSVEPVSGSLTDHYDPSSKTLRLSESVYANRSVAALGVAAHETGHAVQHATGYGPLTLRTNIAPACSVGSKLAIPMVFLGVVLSAFVNCLPLIYAGIILFSLVVFFQIVTLPVEFDASHRAMDMLTEYGFLNDSEAAGARKVLTAAALTYVAAAATSIINLLRLLAMVNGGSRRR